MSFNLLCSLLLNKVLLFFVGLLLLIFFVLWLIYSFALR